MRKVLRWLVFFPVGAILVVFLIANRQPVAISLDPFSVSNPAIATPPIFLWVWLMLALLTGVGLGAAGMWMSGRELRIRAKADRLELKALKKAAAQSHPSTPPQTLPSTQAGETPPGPPSS
ncbi:MAG: LapA family protein [Parvularculaceae bacterium]|nr:LapA family protein [Parvularculaceae bacterium]